MIRFFVFLFVLLITTPLWAQDSLRFQKEVIKLIAGDSAVNKKDVILFTGSSSIRLWASLKKDFPNRNVINRGFGGSEMTDLVNYVDKLIVPYHPNQIFIYEGDNDLGVGKSPEEILVQADKLLLLIREKLPRKTQILFISPKPSLLRWKLKDKYQDYNQKLEAWTKQQKNVTFVDVWTPMLEPDGNVKQDLFLEDSLHMNRKGYDIWAKVIGPYIK
ncbi:MAG: SGNH/GDSL hydrolase family protein [Bacteroidota bacterium]